MADLLTSIRAEIDARLRELAPAIAEYERLSTAADALLEDGPCRVATGETCRPTVGFARAGEKQGLPSRPRVVRAGASGPLTPRPGRRSSRRSSTARTRWASSSW